MNEIQTEAADHAAKGCVEAFRQAKKNEWTAEREALIAANPNAPAPPEEIYPGTIGTDDVMVPVEVALMATVRKAFEDAFGGIISAVNPGESQMRAPDGAIPGAGMQRDPVGGHLVGVEPAPLPLTTTTEYPKWIKPHDSHVTRSENGVVTVAGSNGGVHIARGSGEVTVLCQDEEDEQRYSAAKQDDADAASSTHGDPVNETTDGMGVGSDPTGSKTVYPATSQDAEKADPEGLAEKAATLNEDRKQAPKKPEAPGQKAK